MGSSASSKEKVKPKEETNISGDNPNDEVSSETNSQEENKQSLNTDGSTVVDSNENAQETDQSGRQISTDDGHNENNDSDGNKGKETHDKGRAANDTNNVNNANEKDDIDGTTNDSSCVVTDEGPIIALPNQSDENHDQQTQKANPRDDKATKLEINDREKEHKTGKEDMEKARKKMHEHQKMVSSLKDKFHDRSIKSDVLQVTVTMINSKLRSGVSNSDFKLTKDAEKYEKLRNLKRERGKLLHRLSEIASARLRQNNPDIADLSDENRATKLAEKLSELYDNEWTDLFEATKGKAGKETEDRQIAENLRDILMFCYKRCQKIADKQRSSFISSLNMDHVCDPPGIQSASPGLILRLKELQKNTSQYSLPRTKKVTTAEVSNYANFKKENLVVKHSSKMKGKYDAYVAPCVEITWYMQIQDPPLVLDLGTDKSDKSRYRPFTVSGPQIDYILWPAMCLHSNGPLVAKGVAQFKKDSEPEQANSDHDEKHSETNTNTDQKAYADLSTV